MSDMRLQIDQVIYYPDLMLCCDDTDNDPYLKRSPCLVVEVLSDSTERIDRSEKLYNYRQIPTLQCYLLLSQDRIAADLYRRNEADQWLLQTWTQPTDALQLPCVTTPVTLAQIYERIIFDA
jgi:Uma2 family endonuclease